MKDSRNAVSIFLATCMLALTAGAPDARADVQYYVGWIYASTVPWTATGTFGWSDTYGDFNAGPWVIGNHAIFCRDRIPSPETKKTVAVDNVRAKSITFNDYFDLFGGTVTLTGPAEICTNYNAAISSTLVSYYGNEGMNKTGDATLTLTGTNAWSGTTTISAGCLSVSNDGNLGAVASPLVLAGGRLQITGGSSFVSSRNVVLASDADMGVDWSAYLNGSISGTGSLTKTGIGTLTLGAANTYTGPTTIEAGCLSVSNDGNLGAAANPVVFAGGMLQITGSSQFISSRNLVLNSDYGEIEVRDSSVLVALNGVISGPGSLYKYGSDKLTLAGANTYTGETIILQGTLELANSAALAHSTLNWGSDDSEGSLSFGSLTAATLGGLTGDRPLALTNIASQNVALTVGNERDYAFSGMLSGGGSLTKIGTGALRLNGANTHGGGTTVVAGALIVGNAAALGTGGLTVRAAGTVDLNGVRLNPLSSLSGSRGAVITDNTVQLVDPTVLTVNIAAGGSVYSGSINKGIYNQDIALVKTGSGNLTLDGTSNFGGGTAINGGSLKLGNAAALGTGGLLVVAGIVDLNGVRLTLPSLTGSVGGLITDNSFVNPNDPNPAPTIFTLDIATGTYAYSGAISPAAQHLDIMLVKTGTGTQILNGTCNYTGGTFVNQGTLNLNNATMGNGPIVIAGGASRPPGR
ncbi:MAG: autotransporter-associated beta strand repeat-containing protein [Planctomycetia bacterium]|nr:autotransporter-associated beta strand repeat-containing protein [Planctomycetia bacterium]